MMMLLIKTGITPQNVFTMLNKIKMLSESFELPTCSLLENRSTTELREHSVNFTILGSRFMIIDP